MIENVRYTVGFRTGQGAPPCPGNGGAYQENTRVHKINAHRWTTFPDGKNRSETITLTEYRRLTSPQRMSETASRWAHNPETAGSTPVPATRQ